MRAKSFAAGFVLVAVAVLAASAVISARAEPAAGPATPPFDERVDGAMNPLRTLKDLDIAKAPTTGDDKAACDRATRALARFDAGLSTVRERTRALEHAKSLAATAAMRRAIDSGLLPACPPDIDPEVHTR